MRLSADRISFRYGDGGDWLLKEFSLSVERGESVALVGPSGSGKSTVLKLLSGYITPQSGSVMLDGQPLPAGASPVQLIHQHPEKAINPRWRLKNVLAEADMLKPDVLELFGIESAWLERYPRELSGGELQRFCIARALYDGAHFVLADEISTMLDVVTQAQTWSALLSEARRRNLGLLVVTHNQALAERVCRRIIHMPSAAMEKSGSVR